MANTIGRIHQLIKLIRLAAAKSQATISQEIGITQQAYSAFESGFAEPKLTTIEKFCTVAGVDIIKFFQVVYTDSVINNVTAAGFLQKKNGSGA